MSCRRLALCAALVAACDECPPDPHVVRAMRVMGATFDPPVAPPGGTVTVRVVTVDVEDRPVRVQWYRCPEPFEFPATRRSELSLGDAVARCLAAGPFAEGATARVTVNANGGDIDSLPWRTPRRWTDLVGFACAGGVIEPPPKGGLWPRCTGARGEVFTASVPGPALDRTLPPPTPARITELAFDGAPWFADSPPVVPRCEGSRSTCPPHTFQIRVAGADPLLDGARTPQPSSSSERVVFATYHVSAAALERGDSCSPLDEDALLQLTGDVARATWRAPDAAGDVDFWFTARRLSGGLTVERRRVRVQ